MVHQGSSFTVEEESGKEIIFLLCFFVFVADLLQSILNQAKDRGLLDLPLPNGAETDFPIVQYADDTLLVLEACPKQLFVLKALLNSFANLTALKVNYTKSNIYPINVSDEKMEILSRAFNCQIGRYPFPYLGLPLGLTKPKVDDFLPIVNRIEKRLTSTSMLLNQAGKLEMVNSVLFTCALLSCHQLWLSRSTNIENTVFGGVLTLMKKNPLAAWNRVTRPKSEGGLGVLKISVQNDALLLKNYHKFFNRLDLPWVHLL
jgi:hypothetical protein